MDCQEKEMFYGAETNGDWISSNYAEYNEFLGIGKPQGFLGLKKFFNTQGYQQSVAATQLGGGGKNYGISIGTPTSTNLDPIASIGIKPLSTTYTPTAPTSPTKTPKNFGSTSGLNLSALLNNINANLGIKQDTASTVLSSGSDTNTSDTTLVENQKALEQLQEKGNKGDSTLLYVGLAGAGVLLITGFVYMASKGK